MANHAKSVSMSWTHCGMVTPYDNIEMDQRWRWWPQYIIWADVDSSLLRSSAIHPGVIAHEIPQPSNILLQFHSHFLGANAWSHLGIWWIHKKWYEVRHQNKAHLSRVHVMCYTYPTYLSQLTDMLQRRPFLLWYIWYTHISFTPCNLVHNAIRSHTISRPREWCLC